MDDDALQVSTAVQPGGGVTVEVRGYLDETGGKELAGKIFGGLPRAESRIDIDLHAVTLFSCSGARHLLAALEDLQNQGRQVALVGVRHTLQKILHFAA